jgi:hypothetical protein
VQLANAGDAATSGPRSTTAASLDPSSLAQLEAVAHVRNDQTASRTTEQHARAIAAKLVQPIVPVAEDRPSKAEPPARPAASENHDSGQKPEQGQTAQDGHGIRGGGSAVPTSPPAAAPLPTVSESVAAKPTTPSPAPVTATVTAPVTVPKPASTDPSGKSKDDKPKDDKGGKKP